MKSMQPPLAAIFFMTYFHRAREGHGPLGPPRIRYWVYPPPGIPPDIPSLSIPLYPSILPPWYTHPLEGTCYQAYPPLPPRRDLGPVIPIHPVDRMTDTTQATLKDFNPTNGTYVLKTI